MVSIKKVLLVIACALTFAVFHKKNTIREEESVVNVYDWYGMIPVEVLLEFERETGVRVQYDVYDNNEVLEAKLLASNSGYDVVFPSASPYVARQIHAGVYQPLNKAALSNLTHLDPMIVKHMDKVDPHMVYAIPYYWGTLGFAYDEEKVKSSLSHVDLNSYAVLLDPENLKKLAPFGVSFLEESIDVFPVVLRFLGKNPNSQNVNDLTLATDHLLKLRPYIRRFSSARMMNDLVMGDVCLAQTWSGEVQKAEEEAKELNRSIRYVIPKEGTTLWIDCIAIPKGAPHPKNAHIFINFILRPDISARLTNETKLPTVMLKALPMVDEKIRHNPIIYPPKSVMVQLQLDQPQFDEAGIAFDRLRTRAWAHVRLNKKGS
jgi:putrescine transport system substrate-binding protein